MATNVLDALIADQNARNLQPATAAQILGVMAPQPLVPIAPVDSSNRFNITTGAFGNPYGNDLFNQPSIWERNQDPTQLREQLRLDDLRTVAAQRKFDLEQAQRNAPVQDALLQAQLAHQQAAAAAVGSHDLMQLQKDTIGMNAYSRFLGDLHAPGAPRSGEQGYDAHFLRTLNQNQAMIGTPVGQKILNKFSEDHDTGSAINKLASGYNVASVNVGPRGQTVTMKPVAPDTVLEKDAKGYGLSLARIRNPVGAQVGRRGPNGGWIGDERGDLVRVEGKDGQMVSIPVKEYERLGGTYSGQTTAARTATGSNTPVQVKTIEEANALPSGTVFLAPDGKLRVKP